MSENVSRRDFLKIAGLGTAVSAVLSGCGPMARYVVRRPYTSMPEYNQTGLSTYYASTCRECAAGCGIIVRTKEGRAITVEGNPQHPVNRGRLCARGLTAQQGLYNPDRVRRPVFQARGETSNQRDISWEEAIPILSEALSGDPEGVAFLLGLAPDHLYDLVVELAEAIGAPMPLRYGALGSFEGRSTLVEAARRSFGRASLPYFDLAQADVAFSFGANFLETWLSPVTYSRAYGNFRQARPTTRGYLVVFEPRGSLTAGNADEWIPIRPGSDAILALGLTRLIAEERGVPVPPAAQSVTAQAAAQAADIGEGKLRELAALFAASTAPLAIPGGAALGQPDGLLAAQAVLELNALAGNLGQPGGVFLPQEESPASDLNAVADLVERMNSGQVKALFIHGVNPIFELPSALGFSQALANIPLVISFASFPDETALASDYILPDHTPLESFGYQRILAGTDRPTVSAIQPVVAPLYETRATADVLLEAARQVGGSVADSLNYGVEVTFIQQKIAHLIEDGGLFTAPEVLTFWTRWLQNGGWWTQDAALETPELAEGLDEAARPAQLTALQDNNQFYVITYPNHFGDGSVANRPWIQELPDTSTTVTWNSWVEINPATADRLGIQDDDIVSITTEYGSLEAIVYRFPAIRPDTIALPFGQGHTALGRWAEGRGSNPAVLMPTAVNTAGDQAFGSLLATISPTGRRRPLARVESRLGVYGEH